MHGSARSSQYFMCEFSRHAADGMAHVLAHVPPAGVSLTTRFVHATWYEPGAKPREFAEWLLA